jgi:hypothetical protein
MSEINSWSGTSANNNASPPDGWPEGMQYSSVNNCGREMMGAIARAYADNNGSLTTGGSATAYTLTPNRTLSAYVTGLGFLFKAHATNTGAATLNISALGAKTLVNPLGNALVANEILINRYYQALYDGTNFVIFAFAALQSPALLGNPTAPNQTTGDNSTKIANTAYVDSTLTLYAPKESPVFTGNPQAPTPSDTDDDTSIANTAYVKNQFASQVAAFNYKRTTNQTSGTTVIFDSAVFTQVGTGYNNANGVFTAPATGLYRFEAQVSMFNNTGAPQQQIVNLVGNGTTFATDSTATGAGNTVTSSVSGIMQLSAAQTVIVNISSPGISGVYYITGGYFSGSLVALT